MQQPCSLCRLHLHASANGLALQRWLKVGLVQTLPAAAGRGKGSSEQQALKSKLAEMRTQFQQLLVSVAAALLDALSAVPAGRPAPVHLAGRL